jgi:hypothetical protein
MMTSQFSGRAAANSAGMHPPIIPGGINPAIQMRCAGLEFPLGIGAAQ